MSAGPATPPGRVIGTAAVATPRRNAESGVTGESGVAADGRLVVPGVAGWREHRARYGGLPLGVFGRRGGLRHLADLVERAGLSGRGGAGFPTATKLRAVAAARGRPVVVVNGCESEPASGKDAVLLHAAPHLVLDGAALAAAALRADEVTVAVHRGDPAAHRLRRELAWRGDEGIRWEVAELPRRYVASEASALAAYLGGGEARPAFRPPRISERGVRGRPTLVGNAETFARLARIVLGGPDRHRAAGSPTDPGGLLVTVGGAVPRPGVYEVPGGSTVGAAVDAAGGPAGPVQAVLVGGYGGTWLPLPSAGGWSLRHGPLSGGLGEVAVGAGALVVLPAYACGLAETARVLAYLAQESAGQCGPCVFGLPAIAADLNLLAAGRPDRALYSRLSGRLGVIDGRGACAHPDGAVRLVASALRTFPADLRTHLAGRPCAGTRHPPVLPLPRADQRDGGWR